MYCVLCVVLCSLCSFAHALAPNERGYSQPILRNLHDDANEANDVTLNATLIHVYFNVYMAAAAATNSFLFGCAVTAAKAK